MATKVGLETGGTVTVGAGCFGSWEFADIGTAYLFEGVGNLVFGDCNGADVADPLDLDCIHTTPGEYQALLDAIPTIRGDTDGKEVVEFGDFLMLSANFGTAAVKVTEGNVDLLGGVNFEDF